MFKVASHKNTAQLSGLIIVGLFEGESILQSPDRALKNLSGFLSQVVREEKFRGEFKKTLFFYHKLGQKVIQVLVMGLGPQSRFKKENFREVLALAARIVKEKSATNFQVFLKSFLPKTLSYSEAGEAAAEAIDLALYSFKGYQKIKVKVKKGSSSFSNKVTFIIPVSSYAKEVKAGIGRGLALSSGVKIARDLINEPGNKMNPQIFSTQTKKLGEASGFKVKVLEKSDLIREKMGALLAVGQGSSIPPRLLVLTYGGQKKGAPICFVGKGVTFDAGGISLKPSKGMDKMKYDMAGGAAVVGIMASAAKLKLPERLIGIIPLVENMPGGSAVKPGDVVTSASGLTIEVTNTDAEGRMILADALHYAKKFKPKAVYDLATLTGAVIVALGSRCMAALGDSKLIETLKEAGSTVNERVWELPMFKEYGEDIRSEVADLQNVGQGEAGTIIGAKFLEKFVNKAYPWVHLDIAGMAWAEKSVPSY